MDLSFKKIKLSSAKNLLSKHNEVKKIFIFGLMSKIALATRLLLLKWLSPTQLAVQNNLLSISIY
jgi:hypothetical protein